MKTIMIAGNIGRDAETRTTQGGDTVTSFNIAVKDRSGKEKVTLWFSCSIWGKGGDSLRQYLTKGSKVAVSGDLSTREHEGKTYLQVRVDQVSLMGGGQDRAERHEAPPAQQNALDDEIPFAPEWR
jgi:single-strand DNA-binding protein